MLFILEIILTVVVWNRGWKRLALLPIAFVVGAGFLLGLSTGNAGMSQVTVSHLTPILDIMGIASLALMTARKPAKRAHRASLTTLGYAAPPGFAAPQAYIAPQGYLVPQAYADRQVHQ